MYKKTFTHYAAKMFVDVLFYLSILCVAALPFCSKLLFGWINYPNENYQTAFTIILFISGLCCIYILYILKRMYKSLLTGNPFTAENVNYFRKISVICAVIALIYVIKAIFLFTFATLIIIIIFIVGCLFCLTLKDLFKQAINYKTENELTI